MTETTKGPVDNYLSAEEEAYFNNRGSEESETKIEEAIDNVDVAEQDASADASGSTEDEPSDADVVETDGDSWHGRDESISGDEEDRESESKPRDYEKAFKTERHKRKELKEALEETNRKTVEMERAFAELKASMSQKPAPAPEPKEFIPDPEEDPLGYQQYKIDKLERTLAQHNEYLSRQQVQSQRSEQDRAFMQSCDRSVQEFAKATPDYFDAYKFVKESKLQEHMVSGYSREQAENILAEEELALALKAHQDRVNPAERIYKLAQTRGFKASSKAPSSVKNFDALQKGMNNAKSLKSGGGSIDSKSNSVDIDKMSFAEFDAHFATHKAQMKGR